MSQPSTPSALRIGIVTACFNNPRELADTMASVDKQTRQPDEHLIIDGSTTDAIKRLLEETPQPAYRRWICEPDEGISDAFNKGLRNSTCEVLHLLNSGDYYYDEHVLELVEQTFDAQPHIQWLHGKYYQQIGGEWMLTGKPMERKKLVAGMGKFGHPTMFVRKAMYEQYGYFKKSYRYAMDYEFLLRVAHEPFTWLDRPITVFTPGGNSDKPSTRMRTYLEGQKAYRDIFGSTPLLYYHQARKWVFYRIMEWPPIVQLLKRRNR
jgi:glycosyltransferase involved in cell wall biosynthesis